MSAESLKMQIPAASAIRADLARRHLKDFIQIAWDLVEPETELKWNWHLDEECEVLESVTRDRANRDPGSPGRRVIINVPPGTGKSLVVSVFWPAWEWIDYPEWRYLTASYTDDNTIRDNRRLRDIVTSDWYRAHYWENPNDPPEKHVRLASDQFAKVRFDNTAKGFRIATSVGGMGTGEHPDRIIIDDPHKAKEAQSDTSLNEVWSWFKGTISTRKARDPDLVIVKQRLHEKDLSGRCLKQGGWEHICFPMRYDPDGKWDCDCHQTPDPRDRRSEPGELLWPGLYPEEKVRELEIDLGPFDSSGQLGQRPVPIGGGLFKEEWFEIVDAVPVGARYGRGWDTAATENAGDYTSGVKMAEKDGIYYVVDVKRKQVEDADKTILITAELDGPECRIREEQEPASSGKKVIKAHVKMLAGFDYEGVVITGSKIVRARPFRAQCQAGNVKILRGAWNESYLRNLCAFPFGEHDDDIDASSCIFNDLALEEPEWVQTKATWGRRVPSSG